MILTIIQARMGSTRLPGKAMLHICGKPMLQHVIEAAPEPRIVAVAEEPNCTPILDLCVRLGIPWYVGDANDVLARFVWVVKAVPFRPGWILRLTADSPMITREHIVSFIHACGCKHENTIYTNRPLDYDGLDMELFSTDTLYTASAKATSVYDREHVCPYMYNNFNTVRVSVTGRDFGDNDPRKLSVDTYDDYELVKRLMEETP